MNGNPSIPRTPPASPRDFERRRLLAWRESIGVQERRAADAAIAGRLVIELQQQAVGVLALYWPIRGEPDPAPALSRLASAGWRFALPRVTGRHAPLEFGLWQPGQPMRAVSFGLKLPDPFEATVPDVLVVPCVGFDARGYRLGYGGGYYDRTLGARPVPAVGVAYDGCELPDFVAQAHDRPLDCVITEIRTIGALARVTRALP